ncbi:MAG TPA: MFS transporter, partial [Spirochaetota bacterium]|nr:MFS transporter [Spirochaetota bacterium]
MIRLLNRNVPALFVFSFLGESFFIVPALIPFFHSNGLTTTQIMIVQSVFHVVVLTWEIPSGYIADVIGRKKSMLAGAVFFTAGLGIYSLSSHFILFCVAEAFCGFGWGLRSGADSALLYDSLRYNKKESAYHHLEGLNMSW